MCDYLLGTQSRAKNMKLSNNLENREVLNSLMPANGLKLGSNIVEPRQVEGRAWGHKSGILFQIC